MVPDTTDSRPATRTTSVRRRYAMPEWLNRRDREPLPWTVSAGPVARGEAFTDLTTCRMRIPLGDDETSRCVRAHEMMHAKVSPLSLWRPEGSTHIRDDALVTAEEFRVNQLIKAVGFPVDRHLADGSEVRTGERIGSNGDWNAAVLSIAATCGTRASRGAFTGLRRSRPEWIPRLRAFDRHLKKTWARASASGFDVVASTQPWGEATRGWTFTLEIAHAIEAVLLDPTSSSDCAPDDSNGLATGARGSFARPIVADLPLVHRVPGRLRTSRTAALTGRHPRHLQRLLTDPERRIFERRTRAAGGVIVVDQSGSMRLTDEQVWDMLRAAPGCTVIGYSHEARSTTVSNLWILAKNGRVVDRVPRGNGGNGVDGPALHWAASMRSRHDPFIWVCDGYVTDAYDDHDDALTRVCADLVSTYRIHQVPDIPSAIAALSRAARGSRLPVQGIGPVQAMRSQAQHS